MYHNTNCIAYDYNEELAKQIQPMAEIAIMTIIVVSAILDIAAYKFRHLANAILYLDCMFVTFTSLIPSTRWNSMDSLSINIVYILMMICYYTEHIGQVIYITVMHIFIRFVVSRNVYNQFLEFESILNECFYILGIFIFNLSIAALFAYIPSLQERMRSTIL